MVFFVQKSELFSVFLLGEKRMIPGFFEMTRAVDTTALTVKILIGLLKYIPCKEQLKLR